DEEANYNSVETPGVDGGGIKERASKGSVVSIADIEKESFDDEAEAREYRGANAFKYIVLRVVVIAVLVALSVALKDDFLDLTDFVGASAITVSCIILPIVFYLKKLWSKIPMYEKVPAILVVLVCCVLGVYVSYNTGKVLFGDPDTSAPPFPFCAPEFETAIYYNASSAHNYENIETPAQDSEFKARASKGSIISLADAEKESLDDEIEAAEYRGGNIIKYVVLRCVIVAGQVVASVLLKDHFLDLSDFVGASCISVCCIILPITFYLKKMWTKVPIYEKVPAILVVLVCCFLGGYVSYLSGKQLFNPDEPNPEINFPFCEPEFERYVYFNATA
ncbi:hypothetical protein PybrP1_010406, partial [[Pythium] brassicae (nom. inval.)]